MSFWQGKNGFVGELRLFRPGRRDEIPLTKARSRSAAQARLTPK
jgi:hypothetical protein